MTIYISTELAREVITRRANGEGLGAISAATGIPLQDIKNILERVGQALVPLQRNKKPTYELTIEDKRKGGAASHQSRNEQRDNNFAHIKSLLNTKNKAVEMALIIYLLQHGSSKEFSVTIQNESIGLVFLKALLSIGTPINSIHFNWRAMPIDRFEADKVRLKWGELGRLVQFPDKGSSKSLRLRTSSFSINSNGTAFKVSSRGLALAFLDVGREVLNEATR
ncbi:MAG: hypothetical protein RQ867_04915 [Mariprofundaceae bacterium]|nr:hypothetical protein [Mariprofundaceae bacterium]